MPKRPNDAMVSNLVSLIGFALGTAAIPE